MLKVLVVDDDPVNREIFRWSLAPHCDLHERGGGVGAAADIAEHEYDVVLLDAMMPVVDGREVIAELAEARRDLLPRILVVTAATHPGLLEDLAGYEIAGVVDRPYDPDLIRRLLDRFEP